MPEYDSTIRHAEIPGFPGYMVGTDGSVWSCWKRRGLGCGRGTTSYMSDEWKPIRLTLSGGRSKADTRPAIKYLGFDAKGKTLRVHTAILLAFEGPRPTPGHEGRHLNGNPHDNRRDNLAWGTAVQNNRDRNTHGTMPIGEKNGNVRLSNAQVKEARSLVDSGLSYTEVAERFGVGRSTIIYAIKMRS
jgi:hypothetical protein